jgi:hypothetical protein
MADNIKEKLNEVIEHIVHAGGNLDHWLFASVIALIISLMVVSLVHGVEAHDDKINALELRVRALENK